MNMITLENSNLRETVLQAIKTINGGGIVIMPFDTVYGFACDPQNLLALNRIFALKGRSTSKSVGVATDSVEKIEQVAEAKFRNYILDRTPGRFTFVLNSKGRQFSDFCYRDDTIALRIPDSKLVSDICKEIDFIAQTSANKAGEPNCFSIAEIESQFSAEELHSVDLIIDGNKIASAGPSTLIDLTGEMPKQIER